MGVGAEGGLHPIRYLLFVLFDIYFLVVAFCFFGFSLRWRGRASLFFFFKKYFTLF